MNFLVTYTSKHNENIHTIEIVSNSVGNACNEFELFSCGELDLVSIKEKS